MTEEAAVCYADNKYISLSALTRSKPATQRGGGILSHMLMWHRLRYYNRLLIAPTSTTGWAVAKEAAPRVKLVVIAGYLTCKRAPEYHRCHAAAPTLPTQRRSCRLRMGNISLAHYSLDARAPFQ